MIAEMGDYSTTMIETIKIPSGWQRSASEENESAHFSPGGFPNVLFAIWSRHVSLLNHLSLCRVLSFGERVLNKAELESITPILGNMSDPSVFAPQIALVLELRGRRVIVIEGIYLANGYRCRSLFVESSANTFEQIYYIAPAAMFDKFEADADLAFKSIHWRH